MRWNFTDTHVRKFMPYCSIWDQNEPSPNKILVKVENINVLFAFRYNPKTGIQYYTQIQHLLIECIVFPADIMTDVIVREWVIPRGVGGPKGEEVPAISLEWKVNL